MTTSRLQRLALLALLVLVLGASAAEAAPITFNSRAAFTLAAPGLPLENFEAGLVAANSVTICNGPLSSAVASACFPAGGLLPGVNYSATPGTSFAVLGAGFMGLPTTSKVLGANAFADSLNVTFPSVNAVGLDVFPGLTAGNVLISLFDPLSVPIGAFIINAPTAGTFFGVISPDALIGRINVSSQTGSPGELIDNLAFGRVQNTPAVPEPTSLILFGTGVLSLIACRRRR